MTVQEDVVVLNLRLQCEACGGQKVWAQQNGISTGYVNDVLQNRRAPGKVILRALGYVRVVRYARVEDAR